MSGFLATAAVLVLLVVTSAASAAHPVLPVRVDKTQAASYASAVAPAVDSSPPSRSARERSSPGMSSSRMATRRATGP